MGDHEKDAGPPAITVTGHQWWWEIEYQIGAASTSTSSTPTSCTCLPGKPVDIELRTHDVIHSFWVPRLHGKVDLMPGFTNRIRIQADEPGVYRGECAEYCGPQHAHMILLVDVQPQAEFDAWLGRARQPAPPPARRVRGARAAGVHEQCVRAVSHHPRHRRARTGRTRPHAPRRREGIAANSLSQLDRHTSRRG